MLPCKACGTLHNPMLDCGRAKRIAEASKPRKRPKQSREQKTGLSTAARIDDHAASNTTVSGANARKGDRHAPGYQANLMRARRAVAAGRAERWPRTTH